MVFVYRGDCPGADLRARSFVNRQWERLRADDSDAVRACGGRGGRFYGGSRRSASGTAGLGARSIVTIRGVRSR